MTFIPRVSDTKTAFGELSVAEPTPIIQVKFPYGINSRLIETRINNSGTATAADSMATITTGAAANSGTVLITRSSLDYMPGQGAIGLFTAIFTTGVANSTQTIGVGGLSDGFFFGYNGADFGVLRRVGGHPEIQTISVTNGATVGTGNITITLDSVAKTVAVVNGDTAREVAVKIADADYSDTGRGWDADVDNDTVIFTAWTDGDKSGTFSFVDTDTTGVAASMAETVAGVSATDSWTAQASWSKDVMDGTGTSGITLDTTKGNIYQIKYQWLGFGAIDFSISHPETKEYILVHRIEYANANTTTSVNNPVFPLCAEVDNAANTSDLTMKVACLTGFVEGKENPIGIHYAASADNTGVGATEIPILSLKNKLVFNSLENRSIALGGLMTIASDGVAPFIFRARVNPTLTGPVAFTDVDSESFVSIDSAATGITGGDEFISLSIQKVDSFVVDLHDFNMKLNPGEVVTITALTTSGVGQDATVGITWLEFF